MQLSLVEGDPVVRLVYALMKRGSVTPRTMKQVIEMTRSGHPSTDVNSPKDRAVLDQAQELCQALPWYQLFPEHIKTQYMFWKAWFDEEDNEE